MIMPAWVGPVVVAGMLLGSHWAAYSHGVSVESDRRDALAAGELRQAREAEQAQAQVILVEVKRTHETLAAIPDNRDELERLRQSNAALGRQLSDAAAAAKHGDAATKAALVYAELLERAEARIAGLERIAGRAVEMAGRYDDAHARGELSAVTYQSLGR